MSTATFDVPDISCEHCKHSIEGALSGVEGLTSAKVDVRAKTVTVAGERLDEQAIIAAIAAAGYEVVG